MTITGVRTTYRLVSMGVLPVWAGVLLTLCAAMAAFLLLRSELRQRRRRKAPALLYAARCLLAVCLGVLLTQPVLFIRREWDQPGVLVLAADRSRSMLRADPYPDAMRLDLASALKCPGTERRETLPGRIRQHFSTLEPIAETWRQQAVAIQEELGQGLPWGAAFDQTVTRLGKEVAVRCPDLGGLIDALGKLESRMAAEGATSLPKVSDLREGMPRTLRPEDSPEYPPEGVKPSGGSVAPDPKLFAPVYLVADRLALLRDTLGKSAGRPLDEAGATVLVRAHDDFLASLRAAVPALAALQQGCDERFLAALPQAVIKEIEALSKRSRFGLATDLGSQIAGDPALAARHRVRLLGFEELTSANALENTDLYAPIDQLLRDSLDEVVSGVVVLTDGRQNLPERLEVLRRLASRDAALILAGVGVGGEVPGVAIVDCQAPGVLLGGQEAALGVDLKAIVPKGTPIQVELSCGAKSLASQSIEADGTGQTRVALSFRAPEAGEPRSRQRQEAVGREGEAPAEPPPGADGVRRTADSPSLLVTASCRLPPADRLLPPASCRLAPCVIGRPARVLVVAKWARWDIVYLLSAFRKKPCRVDLALWGAAADKGVGRGPGFGKIPDQLSHLKRYDLVVLDGEPFAGMTQEDGALFASYVRELGGTLLIIADAESWYGQKLPGILPNGPLSAVGGERSAILPPGSAATLPAVSLSLDTARTLGLWGALPPAQRLWAVPDQMIPLLGESGRTVLSVGFHGRGKVYAFGCGDLFRLREWGNDEPKYPMESPTIPSDTLVQRFLSNLLDDALQPAFRDEKAKLALYPFAPRAGSTAHVLLDGAGTRGEVERPEAGGTRPEGSPLRAFPSSLAPPASGLPTSSPLPLTFEPLPSSPGLGHATFRVGAAGRITIDAPGVPSLPAAVASAVSREDIDVSLDEATLRRLASGQKAAGGAYAPLHDLARVVADLPARVDHRVAARQVRLWSFWGLLPALAALMVVDWVLRRRNGLVL